MDEANSVPWGFVCFDAVNQRITVAYEAGDVAGFPLSLKDFACSTNTWGASYARTGPAIFFGGGDLLIKANGDKVVLFESLLASTTDTRIKYTIWNGSAWSAPQVITDHTPDPEDINFRGAAIEPASQNIHCVYSYVEVSGNTLYYHRVLQTSGALGPVTLLDTQVFNGPQRVDLGHGRPISFFQNKVYIFAVRGELCNAKVGTPAALPTAFSEVAIANHSASSTDSANNSTVDITGLVSEDGSQLTALHTSEDGELGHDAFTYSMRIYRSVTSDGTTWSESLFFDFWPSWDAVRGISPANLGTGGVDGIGAFANFPRSAVMFYMRACECDGGAVIAADNYGYTA